MKALRNKETGAIFGVTDLLLAKPTMELVEVDEDGKVIENPAPSLAEAVKASEKPAPKKKTAKKKTAKK